MTTLARFSAGRILLHLLAMFGDGCVRFHVAGIMREMAQGLTPLCGPPRLVTSGQFVTRRGGARDTSL